jgi:hypothetical protein
MILNHNVFEKSVEVNKDQREFNNQVINSLEVSNNINNQSDVNKDFSKDLNNKSLDLSGLLNKFKGIGKK